MVYGMISALWMIIAAAAVAALVLVIGVFSGRNKKPEHRAEPAERPQAPAKDETEKWIGRLVEAEKKKYEVERDRAYTPVLRDCMTAMQYLAALGRFAGAGGKLSGQQREIILDYRVIGKSGDVLKKAERLEKEQQAFDESAVRSKYRGTDPDRLQKICRRMESEVRMDGGIKSGEIVDEMRDRSILETLAGMDREGDPDWKSLSRLADSVSEIFGKYGLYFLFQDDERVAAYGLQKEFNRGSSVDISVPGVFIADQDSGRLSLLEGFIGIDTE